MAERDPYDFDEHLEREVQNAGSMSRLAQYTRRKEINRHAGAPPPQWNNQATYMNAPLPSPLIPSPIAAYPELTILPANASHVARAIFQKPKAREIAQRDPNFVLKFNKKTANLEAVLAYERGEEARVSCGSCAKESRPRGPFKKCVVLDGSFDGACCNCRYNDMGSGCTLHNAIASPNTRKDPRCRF
jgi:Protein of unknown function (DUF3716)